MINIYTNIQHVSIFQMIIPSKNLFFLVQNPKEIFEKQEFSFRAIHFIQNKLSLQTIN